MRAAVHQHVGELVRESRESAQSSRSLAQIREYENTLNALLAEMSDPTTLVSPPDMDVKFPPALRADDLFRILSLASMAALEPERSSLVRAV